MIFDWKRRLQGRVYREDGDGGGGDGGGDGGGGGSSHGGGDGRSDRGSSGGSSGDSSGGSSRGGSSGGGGNGGLSSLGGFGGSTSQPGSAPGGSFSYGGYSPGAAASTGPGSLGGLGSLGGFGSFGGFTGNKSAANSLRAPTGLENLGANITGALESPSTWAKSLLGFITGGPLGLAMGLGSSLANQYSPGMGSVLSGFTSAALSGNPLSALMGAFQGEQQARAAGDTSVSTDNSAAYSTGGKGLEYGNNGLTNSAAVSGGVDMSGLSGLISGLEHLSGTTASGVANSELSNPAVSALSQYNQTDQGTSNVQNSATSLGFGSNTASPGFGNPPPSLSGLFAQSGTSQQGT